MAVRPVMLGQPIRRKEDPRLIRGKGTYTDDIRIPGALHAAFVRSDSAAGRIVSVDASRALARGGVLAIYTFEDVRGKIGRTPCFVRPEGDRDKAHPVLADGVVRYVGQPIACVIAEDAYIARDAALEVSVRIEPRDAVVDVERAAEAGSPCVYSDLPYNHCMDSTVEGGDPEALFREADARLEFRLLNQRLAPVPMEGRAVLALWDPGLEKLTVWSSTQAPHRLKQQIAASLGVPEIRVRVIAPEVGGGFGCKLPIYPEECLLPWIARELERPIRWMETRTENLMNTTHGRDHVEKIEVAYNRDGRVLALRGGTLQNVGAYQSLFGGGIAAFTPLMLPGCYRLEGISWRVTCLYTNTIATDAYRGAGRPEAAYMIEQVMDAVARELGLDPVEVRRRNLIPKEAFPYETITGNVYDSGDYEGAIDRALELFAYERARTDQERARGNGELVGIGLSLFTEICGLGPSTDALPLARSGTWESATIRVEPSGNAVVLTGISPHGQGQETVFAQMVADAFGLALEDVEVVHGDTDVVQHGVGTFGSRGIAVGGAALAGAIVKVREKATRIAAHLLDTTPDQVELEGGVFTIRGADRKLGFRDVAEAAHLWTVAVPGEEPGLEASSFFEPSSTTFPFGAHVCQVRIDRETGEIALERYVAVDDCGNVLNPLLADGQRIGGIVQGLGQALCEEVLYDDAGQLLTATLMDYAVPRARMFPRFELAQTCTPTEVNPLGAKGLGELGTIGSTPCIVSAVLDALAPLGVRHLDMPLKPERIWRAIRGAQ
ncbi:MAG: xanthine dehydrogenase family protein molybdopterin-binding subunit [Myxococcota bacterium]